MEIEYIEIREAAFEAFDSLHGYLKYPIVDAFYAFIDDYEKVNEEKMSAIISFCVILVKKRESIRDSKELQECAQIIYDSEKIHKLLVKLDPRDKMIFYSDLTLLKATVQKIE